MATKKQEIHLDVPALQTETVQLTLIGDSPLVCHAWSQKAIQEMLDKQLGKPKTKKRAPKDPEQDFKDSLYEYPGGGYGFPAVAFKNAAVSACRQIDGITMAQTKGTFHIIGDPVSQLVKIEGSEPVSRQDMVRVGQGTADIRYRGEFRRWKVDIEVMFNTGVFSFEQITNLMQIAGFAVGIGEWRPEKGGQLGMFRVASSEDVARFDAEVLS